MLNVKGLSKEFVMYVRGGLKIEGFSDISFSACKGKLHAITGASGIGKSTLLKCIYRTYKPTAGSIEYISADGSKIDLAHADDQKILKLRKTEIGYVSQFLHVIPRVSALDILTERLSRSMMQETGTAGTAGISRTAGTAGNAGTAGIPRIAGAAETVEAARYYLDKVGINRNLWNMYPSTFSGGEKQRFNILLALAANPRILLLDEPTASLDANSKDIILNLILETKKKGTTMVGVFHDRDAIKALADSRYDMRKNETVAV